MRRSLAHGLLLLVLFLGEGVALKRGTSAVKTEGEGDGDGGSMRPSRGGDIFDAPEGEAEAPNPATPAIVADMRAHLKRAHRRAEADLIGSNRNIVIRLFSGVVGFFGSEYFRNVRRSVGVFIAAWLWYVFNTKTYTPPEYDD